LIYLNPEGPMGQPDPYGSAKDVRDAFGRMSMNDLETVALIGGGHAFGKSHGACPLGPGPSPQQQPWDPWPGKCGTGKGKDTFTSGFEGPWSTKPTTWGNYYFRELVQNSWSVWVGPGGRHQWKPSSGENIMMLTSDISLTRDSAYSKLVNLFATNLTALRREFSLAWYKLTSRDMGPVTRCKGPYVPPAEPFQNPLPPPVPPCNVGPIVSAITSAIFAKNPNLPPDPSPPGRPYYGAYLVHLAWQCMTTFRSSDYQGGCNGARIRFDPQKSWPSNVELDSVLTNILAPIQEQFKDKISWSDLIILAGNTALELATGIVIPFQSGRRSDALDGEGSRLLQPNGNYAATFDEIRRQAKLIGLTDREIVALSARCRSIQMMNKLGYSGSYTQNPTIVDSGYFVTLLGNQWKSFKNVHGNIEYRVMNNSSQNVFMTPSDLNLIWDTTFLAIAQDYAVNNTLLTQEFLSAWVKLTNIDLF